MASDQKFFRGLMTPGKQFHVSESVVILRESKSYTRRFTVDGAVLVESYLSTWKCNPYQNTACSTVLVTEQKKFFVQFCVMVDTGELKNSKEHIWNIRVIKRGACKRFSCILLVACTCKRSSRILLVACASNSSTVAILKHFALWLCIRGFLRGHSKENVSPTKPGGIINFITTVERHRRCHSDHGNCSSDENFSLYQTPYKRSRRKKKSRGRRLTLTESRRTMTPPPPKPQPELKRRRIAYLNSTKNRAVEMYNLLLETHTKEETAEEFEQVFPAIQTQNVLRWRRGYEELKEDMERPSMRHRLVSTKYVKSHSECWFPEAEAILFDRFLECRRAGRCCSCLWFCVTMKLVLKELIGEKASDFVAGEGWRARFFMRRGLSMRAVTNISPKSVVERVPQVLHFFKVIQRECAKNSFLREWGRFSLARRFNADEVGVEFGHILHRTAELKGTKRVWSGMPKHKIEIRECTLLPLFCAGAAVIGCSIILRCAPKKIGGGCVDPLNSSHGPTQSLIDNMRSKYPFIDIYCQRNGYMDDRTFVCWFEHTFLRDCGDLPTLLVLDNLGAHQTAEVLSLAADHHVTLLFSPPNCTDLVQVTDDALGRILKRKVKNQFLDHFMKNTRKWQDGKVTPHERKKLHIKWIAQAVTDFYDNDNGQKLVLKIFGHCGLASPLHERGKQVRKIPGHTDQIVVNWEE